MAFRASAVSLRCMTADLCLPAIVTDRKRLLCSTRHSCSAHLPSLVHIRLSGPYDLGNQLSLITFRFAFSIVVFVQDVCPRGSTTSS